MNNYNINGALQILKLAWTILAFGSINVSADNLQNMTSIDINIVKNSADVIIISKLEQIHPPYEVLGISYYKIIPEDILAGSLPENSLVVVETNIDTWKGSPPMVEPAFSYLLFLKQIELSEDVLPPNYSGFELVGNWKGIISIDNNAAEQRAIQSIERQYNISINNHKMAFINALKYSLKRVKSDNEMALEALPDDAAYLYKKMGMHLSTSNKYEVAQ